MYIIYKSTYVWNALTTLFMEIYKYSMQWILECSVPVFDIENILFKENFSYNKTDELIVATLSSLHNIYKRIYTTGLFLYWDVMVHYIQLSRSNHISYLYLIGFKRVWAFGVYIFPEVTSWMAVQIPGGSVGCHGTRCKGAELSQPHAEGIENEN